MSSLTPVVAGGGMAGCEAAWAMARAGVACELVEMRPAVMTEAHVTGTLAELVCSNSLRSSNPENAVGLLKQEMSQLGSIVMQAASGCRVPAGDAFAVDRALFSRTVENLVENQENITVTRAEVTDFPRHRRVIVATGPLTSPALSRRIAELTGSEHLYFYDAIAPVVSDCSIDRSVAFPQSRYDKGGGDDYLNCPMDAETYHRFVEALLAAEKVPARAFEKELHFAGCMPVEAIAASGAEALAHGPLKPVGLTDPATRGRPYAVVQLRRENASGTAWNLVGCQTKLMYPEQARVFRMVPGLGDAEFLRFGSMHRNTFINGPAVLDGTLRLVRDPMISFAGQIAGVEGYVESAACGILAGLFAASGALGAEFAPPPPETAMGSLLRHATASPLRHFQPSNVNYGLFPPLPGRIPAKIRNAAYAERAREAFARWIEGTAHLLGRPVLP